MFDDHLEKSKVTLDCIAKAGLKMNTIKLYFGRIKIEYLGYWVIANCIQLMPNKVNSILEMQTLKNCKQFHAFIGLVKYYQDMWRHCSHAQTCYTVTEQEMHLTVEPKKNFALFYWVMTYLSIQTTAILHTPIYKPKGFYSGA